ncbi:MAG: methionine--tRNA ligase [Kiritimatiellaeota bacterium]|nr:methionine--tRNA ligase [Kiritimatiellota bacterium]
MSRRIVVTAALPYANGEIHLGHLVEYLQTDFWVRFQKMRGHECLYICADDTHGTPIMIRARAEGIAPEALIARSQENHIRDFSAFGIAFDNYYSTNSPENKALAEAIFKKMEEAGHIVSRDVPQLYCEKDGMFLPDRFVRGTCPQCNAANQYGDSCDACGATYSTSDLKDARCSVCGGVPVLKASEHLFVELDHFRDYLREWLPSHTAQDVANKMMEWFGEPLKPWDVSRDAPYFGFEIPGHEGKYFYVWLDAPVGYLASLTKWCADHGKDFNDYWNNAKAERYHFIGKDIVRFHCLFWPAMLKSGGFLGPDKVFVHGFLTVNGEKMSKSKGTFVNAKTYLDHLNPMYLRYYYACKLNGTTDDLDLNLDEFVTRVNAELVGKITNLASRAAQMLHKRLEGKLGTMDEAGRTLFAEAQSKAEAIAAHYERRDFNQAMIEIRDIADLANKYFDDAAPWQGIKTDPEATRRVLTATLNHFRLLAIYLAPVLPDYAARVATLFGETPFAWDALQQTRENCALAPYEYLAERVDPDKVKAMVESSKSAVIASEAKVVIARSVLTTKQPSANNATQPSIAPGIEFPDFQKVDLRVAEILAAECVEGSDKLLKIMVSLGSLGERCIFSGIRQAYPDPATLVGRKVAMVANLAPRKMGKFGTSEGMILAAGSGAPNLFLLSPDSGASAGDTIQ